MLLCLKYSIIDLILFIEFLIMFYFCILVSIIPFSFIYLLCFCESFSCLFIFLFNFVNRVFEFDRYSLIILVTVFIIYEL